jgi:hypothetical protein
MTYNQVMKYLTIFLVFLGFESAIAQTSQEFKCKTQSLDQINNIIELQFKTSKGVTSILFSNYDPATYKENKDDSANWRNAQGEFRCQFTSSEIDCKGLKDNEMFKLTKNRTNRARINYQMSGRGAAGFDLDSSSRPEDCRIFTE